MPGDRKRSSVLPKSNLKYRRLVDTVKLDQTPSSKWLNSRSPSAPWLLKDTVCGQDDLSFVILTLLELLELLGV